MNMPFDIRNPELAKLVQEAESVDAALLMKVILVVDNALNINQRNQQNDNANVLRRVIDLEASIKALRTELTNERERRAKVELEQAERQVQVAKERLKLSTDAKLEVQEIFKRTLEQEVGEALEDKNEAARIARAKWWSETFSAMSRAVLIAISVPVALGILAAIILFLAKVFHVAL